MKWTAHGQYRRCQRGIAPSVVEAVIAHGRLIYSRRAQTYFLGRREVRMARELGIELGWAENTQVIVSHDGAIITTYRTKRPARDEHSRDRRRHARRSLRKGRRRSC